MRALPPPKLRLCWLLLLGLAGCGSSPPAASASSKPAPPSPIEPSLGKDGWGVLRSQALGVKLALPAARAWLEPASAAPAAARSSWELRHEPTGSTLVVRRWRASRVPQLDACEREAHQRSKDVPEIDETNLVATRTVRAPEGFLTRVSLLSLPGTSARLRGLAVAIGAGVGECLAAVASTECNGEEELAERLRLLDTALGHLRLIHVEDRVPMPAHAEP